MNIFRIIKMSFANTFRSKLRTFLTATAIFIGAFTLMLTNGIGTGINSYIDTQLGSIGGENIMNVTKTPDNSGKPDAPKKYDPNKTTTSIGGSPQLEALTPTDIKTLEGINGVKSVRPVYFVNTDYIGNGENKYQVNINVSLPGGNLDYSAGHGITNNDDNQVVISEDYIEPLGFASAQDSIGKSVEIGASTPNGKVKKIEATVVGVQKPVLIDLGMNTTEKVRQEIYNANREGIKDAPETFLQAQVEYDNTLDDTHTQDLKDAIAAKGMTGMTVTDQIGMFKTIIDVIVTVLNGFALIALIAAGFGIINTLLMSVQERTREIGLMKAMGLSSGKVFSLFSFEALFIGVIGSMMGLGVGYGVGTVINNVARSQLEALGGIDVIIFTAPNMLAIVATILIIAFIAGTLPAARAAKQNPIDALRYE